MVFHIVCHRKPYYPTINEVIFCDNVLRGEFSKMTCSQQLYYKWYVSVKNKFDSTH